MTKVMEMGLVRLSICFEADEMDMLKDLMDALLTLNIEFEVLSGATGRCKIINSIELQPLEYVKLFNDRVTELRKERGKCIK
jgi:phage gp29-like protein